jgi:hypothetical protein
MGGSSGSVLKVACYKRFLGLFFPFLGLFGGLRSCVWRARPKCEDSLNDDLV